MKQTLRVLAVFGLLVSGCATAAPSAAPPIQDGAVYLEGDIGVNAVLKANGVLHALTAEPGVVQVVINSPGGSIMMGDVFITALEIAKARGWRVDCYVPFLAASMAFQILAHCDDRYVFAGTMLLWHPARVAIEGQVYTSAQARSLAEELARTDHRLFADLTRLLDPASLAAFVLHYEQESLLLAPEVLDVVGDDFATIVSDMPGLRDLIPQAFLGGGGGRDTTGSRLIYRASPHHFRNLAK